MLCMPNGTTVVARFQVVKFTGPDLVIPAIPAGMTEVELADFTT